MPGRTAYLNMKAAARDAGVPQQAGMPVTPDLINKFGIKIKSSSDAAMAPTQPVTYVNPQTALRTANPLNVGAPTGNTYKSGSNFTAPVQQSSSGVYSGQSGVTAEIKPNLYQNADLGMLKQGVNQVSQNIQSQGAAYYAPKKTGYAPAMNVQEQFLNRPQENVQQDLLKQQKQQDIIQQVDKKASADQFAVKKPKAMDIAAAKSTLTQMETGAVQPAKGFDIGNVMASVQSGGTINPQDFSAIMSSPDLANNPIIKMMVEKSLNTEAEKQKALSDLEAKQSIQDELTRKQREIESFYSGKLQNMSTAEAKDALTRQLAATGGLGSSRNQQMLRDIDTKVQLAKDRQNELNQLSDMITQSNNAAERNNLISQYGQLKLKREEDISNALQEQYKIMADNQIKGLDAAIKLSQFIKETNPEFAKKTFDKDLSLSEGKQVFVDDYGNKHYARDPVTKELLSFKTDSDDKYTTQINSVTGEEMQLKNGVVISRRNPYTGMMTGGEDGKDTKGIEVYDSNKPGRNSLLNYSKIFLGSSANGNGVDFSAPSGTPVKSNIEGKVTFIGENNDWGYQVKVQDADGNIHQYSHLRELPNLQEGQTIKRGMIVGNVGNTGNVMSADGKIYSEDEKLRNPNAGAHLDYTVYDKDNKPYSVYDALSFSGSNIGDMTPSEFAQQKGESDANRQVAMQILKSKAASGTIDSKAFMQSMASISSGDVPPIYDKDLVSFREGFNKNNTVDTFRKAQSAYQKVNNLAESVKLGSKMTPQDQMGMIYSFIKNLDPSSTVMMGEYAGAEDTQGLYDKLKLAYKKAEGGDKLNENQVIGFMNASAKLMNAATDVYNQHRDRELKFAKTQFVQPELAVGEKAEYAPLMMQDPDGQIWEVPYDRYEELIKAKWTDNIDSITE